MLVHDYLPCAEELGHSCNSLKQLFSARQNLCATGKCGDCGTCLLLGLGRVACEVLPSKVQWGDPFARMLTHELYLLSAYRSSTSLFNLTLLVLY